MIRLHIEKSWKVGQIELNYVLLFYFSSLIVVAVDVWKMREDREEKKS